MSVATGVSDRVSHFHLDNVTLTAQTTLFEGSGLGQNVLITGWDLTITPAASGGLVKIGTYDPVTPDEQPYASTIAPLSLAGAVVLEHRWQREQCRMLLIVSDLNVVLLSTCGAGSKVNGEIFYAKVAA